MLPSKIAFVDIETTGTRSSYDRIIEIGILRVENNKLVRSFQSIINPQAYLPKEITMLTGITQQDIENAPSFRTVKEEILEILKDCTFVAHNVRFDYAFLKQELLREHISFTSRHFCTVKLSRHLFPQWQRHNLDTLMQECNIACMNRHRAYDDAQVLYEFYQYLLKTIPPEQLEKAIAKTMKKPSLPVNLPIEEIDTLPEKPGVYIFFGDVPKVSENETVGSSRYTPLYVGKSVNIRNRVLSHFSSDIASSTEMQIAQQVKRIETITTAGELGALLLESKLIKELLPIYNKKSRIRHELLALKKRRNKEGFDECYLEKITKIDAAYLDDFLGFYRSRKQAKAALADMAKTYQLCEKLMGLEKTPGACFAYRLNRCSGACVGEEKTLVYNLKLQTAFSENKILPWPFKGAILIRETDGAADDFGMQEKHEFFLIDNWCYLGTVSVDQEGLINDQRAENALFDLDVYKILRQFFRNPANRKKISTVRQRRRTASA